MFLVIDNRMRSMEKEYLRFFGYSLIELPKSQRVYAEISSHADIFVSKTNNNLIIEPSAYESIMEQVKKYNFQKECSTKIVKAEEYVQKEYPLDIKYNVCCFGNYAIHNFKYTSKMIREILDKEKFELINVKQGYTNCSIAVIDDKSIITSDKGIYKTLSKYDFNILFVEEDLDIKLLSKDGYSKKKGFIGGCISRIENKVFVSGDLNKIDNNKIIRKFIENRNLEIIEFLNEDVIDYGGIISFI